MFHRKTRTPEYQIAGDEVAVIETGKGTIRVKLDSDGAPIHVANFCELATMGFYDGLVGSEMCIRDRSRAAVPTRVT